MASEEKYASIVGGTAKQAGSESAVKISKRDDKKKLSNDRMRDYLYSVTAATTVNFVRMQEVNNIGKSKDNELAEIDNQLAKIMVRLDDKNARVGKLIMSECRFGTRETQENMGLYDPFITKNI